MLVVPSDSSGFRGAIFGISAGLLLHHFDPLTLDFFGGCDSRAITTLMNHVGFTTSRSQQLLPELLLTSEPRHLSVGQARDYNRIS